MKIEDTPFQAATALEKIRRSPVAGTNYTADDLDLAFLDLITSITETGNPVEEKVPAKTAEKPKESAKAKEAQAKEKTNVRYISPAKAADDAASRVDEDMKLLAGELGPEDVRYMKEAVIPGLPIVMGSVPVQNVFPPDAEKGGISYRGFDVSPKLAELIEKGYKSGRPIRVELDNNSAVVLKIRDGRVSAEFLSNDKGMVLYMQQELDELKNRMAARNLPVGTLEYKHSERQNQRQSQEEQQESGED